MKCPNCGFNNLDDTFYCGRCATPLKAGAPAPLPETRTLQTPLRKFSQGSLIAGKYRILEELGRGGMGVVYKAVDIKLERTVALKFLSPQLTSNQEAKERFIHEAQAASALDHPHICTVYEIGEFEGEMFIAMAYVEGQSLRRKIEQGPPKIEEALDLSIQVAEGLHEAHEKGIVHRDIKSANIMVTPKGQAKIMDFGVAKLAGRTRFTQTGMTMGTAAYMSPEQAKGEKVDRRTDIWSLGVVLYEMATGQLPFKGDHEQAVVYSILNEEPEPMTGLRTGVPMELERIVSKALAKDPASRYQHIDEMPVDLKAVKERPGGLSRVSTRSAAVPALPARARRHQIAPWILVGLLAALVAISLWSPWRARQLPQPFLTRFVIHLPIAEGMALEDGSAVALSPDETQLIYASALGGSTRLYLRSIHEFEGKPISGTEGAKAPFFSPDGKWAGFYADGKLKKVSLLGGTPQVICEAKSGLGGSWGADDTIYFSDWYKACLMKVSAEGGIPEQLTSALKITSEGPLEHSHFWPRVLPGGKEILFTIYRNSENMSVAALNLQTGKQKTLIERGSDACYLETGSLIYAWEGDLLSVPFDLDKMEVTGSPIPVLGGVMMDTDGLAHYSLSERGSLAYVPGAFSAGASGLVLVDHKGRVEPLPFAPDVYQSPRFSPDGKQLVITRSQARSNLWIYGLERGSMRRLTDEEGDEYWAIWTPDGERIVFNSTRSGGSMAPLFWKPADGIGPEEPFARGEYHQQPQSWGGDGKLLVITEGIHPTNGMDIWLLTVDGDRTPKPLIRTQANEIHPIFSPDGRWLAYVSDESGREEVFVRPYPGPGNIIPISTDGGMEPVWAPDGKKLYYRDVSGDKMMVVSFLAEPDLQVGKPQLLFEGKFHGGWAWGRNYDIAPDGKLFLMITDEEQPSPPTQINMVLNWVEELTRLAPESK